MEKESLSQADLEQVFKLTPVLINLPTAKLWVDHDREVDVLYVSFKRPQRATNSKMLEGVWKVSYGPLVSLARDRRRTIRWIMAT